MVFGSKKEKPRFVAGSLTLKYLLLVYLACGAAEWMQKLKLFLINTTTQMEITNPNLLFSGPLQMGLFKKISRFIGFGGSSQNRNKEIKALTVEKSKPLAKQVASPAVKIVAPKLKPKLAKRNPSKRTPSKRTPSKRTTPSKSNNTNTEEDNAHTRKSPSPPKTNTPHPIPTTLTLPPPIYALSKIHLS